MRYWRWLLCHRRRLVGDRRWLRVLRRHGTRRISLWCLTRLNTRLRHRIVSLTRLYWGWKRCSISIIGRTLHIFWCTNCRLSAFFYCFGNIICLPFTVLSLLLPIRRKFFEYIHNFNEMRTNQKVFSSSFIRLSTSIFSISIDKHLCYKIFKMVLSVNIS